MSVVVEPRLPSHSQEKWPRYRLTAEREKNLGEVFPGVPWRDRYIYYEFETRRTALTAEELEVVNHRATVHEKMTQTLLQDATFACGIISIL